MLAGSRVILVKTCRTLYKRQFNDLVYDHRRGDTKTYNIGKRIKLLPELGYGIYHPGCESVNEIEKSGNEDEITRQRKIAIGN